MIVDMEGIAERSNLKSEHHQISTSSLIFLQTLGKLAEISLFS